MEIKNGKHHEFVIELKKIYYMNNFFFFFCIFFIRLRLRPKKTETFLVDIFIFLASPFSFLTPFMNIKCMSYKINFLFESLCYDLCGGYQDVIV
jgi:hypothetical protein